MRQKVIDPKDYKNKKNPTLLIARKDGAWNGYKMNYDYYVISSVTGEVLIGPVLSEEIADNHPDWLNQIIDVKFDNNNRRVFYIM